MPLGALNFYLINKHIHETRRDNYMADMARFAAWSNVKDGDRVLPRYSDLAQRKPSKEAQSFTIDDVLDMFEGKGKLAGK